VEGGASGGRQLRRLAAREKDQPEDYRRSAHIAPKCSAYSVRSATVSYDLRRSGGYQRGDVDSATWQSGRIQLFGASSGLGTCGVPFGSTTPRALVTKKQVPADRGAVD